MVKNGINITEHIETLTDDMLTIIVPDNPEMLQYLTEKYMKYIKISIERSSQNAKYLHHLSDKSMIELIQCKRVIIPFITNMTENIMNFICKWCHTCKYAVELHFPRKFKRIAIREMMHDVIHAKSDEDDDDYYWFWGNYVDEDVEYYTDYDKFYICTLLNKFSILSETDEGKEIIESCLHITVASILTDGPTHIWTGGFDFDLEFKYN